MSHAMRCLLCLTHAVRRLSRLTPRTLSLLSLFLLLTFCTVHAFAQTQDLTAVVLVDSSNTTDYNTNPATPGTYQMGPERYLVHLQIPYRVVDVSTTSAEDLTTAQLIIAGHHGLSLSAAWQSAITTAVANGTGFVNLDNDAGIGQQAHIQQIFGATGSTIGQDQYSIVVPATVQVGGATPHYIAALQRHFAGDTAGDLTYPYHGNGVVDIPSDATLLTGATGTVVARLGTDPLILATTYGKGRAVDFTTYDYMHPDRFGFVLGADDLFWRSLVWAARKPFVLRGYPRLIAIQMDDNEVGIMSRIPDLWNTTLTGQTAANGTGGPWTPQVNMQLSSLADPGGERAELISAIQANLVHASPHGLNYGSGGDLYWNLTVPNTDAQWQANVASALQWKTGKGGTDTFPTFSRSMVAHYWDISNNSGYEMWNSLGLRYITSPQAPGAYYFTVPKTPAQRIPLGPFRIYEQPPIYSGDEEETFPFFFADDLSVGSVAGKPAQTFFAFGSQVGLSAGRFTRPDAIFPSTQNGYTIAQSLNQWEYYAWRFWSGMAPVQIYTHDGDNLQYTTTSDRQSFITQLSQWFAANSAQHVFMDNMGDYLRARNHSLLATASLSNTALTLNFTGSATDADGNLIDTKVYAFYGDDEGTLLDVPGFQNGASYSFPNTQPASLQVEPVALSLETLPGTSPAAQTLSIANVGSGSFSWTVSSTAPWLTTSQPSGTSNTSIQVSAATSGFAVGSYTASLTFTASGALNSPFTVPVTVSVSPASLVPSPGSLVFAATVGAAAPPAQRIAITNPGGNNLSWTVTSDSSWLSATTITPGTPGSIAVTAVPGSLPLGIYNGNLTLHATGGTVPNVTIPVSLQLSGPVDTPSTANLNAWTLSPGAPASNWTSNGTAILFNGSAESELYTGSPSWTDYDVDVNFTLSSVADYPGGIRARVNPANGSGYALWMYPAEHALTLYSVTNWNIGNGYTNIATAGNITFDTNPHTLRLSVHGNQISGSYDGLQVLSVNDNTYTSGVIALDPSSLPVTYNSVQVSSDVNQSGTFTATPTSLTFAAPPGGTAAAPQTLELASSPTSISWNASTNVPWLTLSLTQATSTPASISVTASAASLSAGNYLGTITLVPTFGTPIQVPVTFNVAVASAQLLVSPASISLNSYIGQPAPTFNLSIANQAGSAFNWSIASTQSWLTFSPASGAANATVTGTAALSSATAGTYTANATVTATGLPNSPVVVPVTVVVAQPTLIDTFSHNAIGWVPSPLGLAANFSVAHQVYSYNGGGNTQSCSGSGTYSDYEFDSGLQLSNLTDFPGGLRARVNPSTGAGYGLWLYPAEGVIKLLNIPHWAVDSATTVIAQAPAKLDTASHTYRLVFAGSSITAYQDNLTLLSATDTSYASGYVCYDPSNQPVSYTNALVISSTPAAILTPSVKSLAFSSSGSPPAPASFTLNASIPVTFGVAASVPWLTASLSSSTTSATITVTANPAGLATGTYAGNITIDSPGSSNAPLVIPVSLAVSASMVGASPSTLDLFSASGSSPSAVTVAVQNLGAGALPWSAASDAAWLTPTPSSASAPGPLTLTPTTASLPIGNSVAHITITAPGSANGSVLLPVTAHIGTAIFTDTFASGSAQWTPSPLGLAGNWSVSANAFHYNGKGHTQQYSGSQSWTNYIVSTGITLSSATKDYPGGLRGRVNLSSGAAYVAWLYPAEKVIKLFRTTGWNIDTKGLTQLGQSASIPFDLNTHNLRLAFSGSQITVFYDNASVISATDTVLPTGAIALDVSSQPVSFSNVLVLQQ